MMGEHLIFRRYFARLDIDENAINVVLSSGRYNIYVYFLFAGIVQLRTSGNEVQVSREHHVYDSCRFLVHGQSSPASGKMAGTHQHRSPCSRNGLQRHHRLHRLSQGLHVSSGSGVRHVSRVFQHQARPQVGEYPVTCITFECLGIFLQIKLKALVV